MLIIERIILREKFKIIILKTEAEVGANEGTEVTEVTEAEEEVVVRRFQISIITIIIILIIIYTLNNS